MLPKSTIWKTAEVFFMNPTKEHYLKDISRKAGLAHTAVKPSLIALEEMGIIKRLVHKKGSRDFPVYKTDMDAKPYKKYKKIYNISSIIESELIDFLETTLMPKSIVLFGSYKRGEDIEDSDIDIFLECEPEKIELQTYEEKLGRHIELHFRENFESCPVELKNNIINGITLSGFLEGY